MSWTPDQLTDLNQGYLFRFLVAHSATFQEVTSSQDADAALERVHYPEAELFDSCNGLVPRDLCPMATISDEQSTNRTETMGVANWQGRSSLLLTIHLMVPHEIESLGVEASRHWIDAQCGKIRREMLALARTGDPTAGHGDFNVSHINLVACEVSEPPFQIPDSEMTSVEDEPMERGLWAMVFACEFF